MNRPSAHIWIDLDNTPHVPFFRPIIAELRQRGHSVVVTARDAYNVLDLLNLYGIECETVGRHYGKHKLMKVLGLGIRSVQLLPKVMSRRPHLAVSHGSRSQTLAAKLLGIRSMIIADYEHVTHLTKPDYLVFPEVVAGTTQGGRSTVLSYPGIKEDVYAATFCPDEHLRSELGLSPEDIVVTFRPPASEAHYHSSESDVLSEAALERLSATPGVKVVLLPRNDTQKLQLQSKYSEALGSTKFVIPQRAVDGLTLVWISDLVISGGGTMNREAAALGVPVYSTFRGPIGALDRYLASKDRLVLLTSADDVRNLVRLVKRPVTGQAASGNHAALQSIVRHIEAAAHPIGGIAKAA